MIFRGLLIHHSWKWVHLCLGRTSSTTPPISYKLLEPFEEEPLVLHPPDGSHNHIHSTILGVFKIMAKGEIDSSRR